MARSVPAGNDLAARESSTNGFAMDDEKGRISLVTKLGIWKAMMVNARMMTMRPGLLNGCASVFEVQGASRTYIEGRSEVLD